LSDRRVHRHRANRVPARPDAFPRPSAVGPVPLHENAPAPVPAFQERDANVLMDRDIRSAAVERDDVSYLLRVCGVVPVGIGSSTWSRRRVSG
jgi:hypothetical protein